jgi:hypothetical protein
MILLTFTTQNSHNSSAVRGGGSSKVLNPKPAVCCCKKPSMSLWVFSPTAKKLTDTVTYISHVMDNSLLPSLASPCTRGTASSCSQDDLYPQYKRMHKMAAESCSETYTYKAKYHHSPLYCTNNTHFYPPTPISLNCEVPSQTLLFLCGLYF